MGRQRISRKAWQRAVNALLWYPDNKKEFACLLEELMTREPGENRNSSKPIHQDPTSDAAIRIANNARYQNLKQEIDAVEVAVASLRPEQAEVIRKRFWGSRSLRGRRKPLQYVSLQDAGYSVEAMKKIVRTAILIVASCLGEA